ncbi:glycosyltransferase family 4 protein [Rhodopila sp.]|uniref:glycosyltransferase family 4 protein n=1 Tax=Rhodopila sp. TaxID=2480087 RepID=UPI002C667CC5|nr:glycosyltransferase family 4 protein [Rhodopila sp.]HVZ07705.1 glycosyltransferase family 4 protein [Rhodopila sp.]
MSARPRIAVACSGLGHIQRGIESWASDLAQALGASGADVTLFSGAPCGGAIALPTLRRGGTGARGLAGGLRHLGGWRYGFGSPYDVEQTSFSLALWRRIRHGFDILHVQDPLIAIWLERARRAGWSKPAVIYANGTGEGPEVMRRFRYLHLLTAGAAAEWAPRQPADQRVFTIPNFIDTVRFSPGDRAAARARFGLPAEGTILLCCAAIRRRHKRIDALLSAFAAARTPHGVYLVIAGGREPDTDELIAEGTALLGDRVRFLLDLPRDAMPALYRAADAFVLPSLYEMFGIVLLEALATGLPVLCNDTADFRAIAGPGALYGDLGNEEAFARGLRRLTEPAERKALGAAGRSHVQARYSAGAVTRAMIAMYETVEAERRLG